MIGRFYLMRNRIRRIEQHFMGRDEGDSAEGDGECLPRQNNRLDAVSGIVLE
jgi:hypothetical protein